MTLDTITIPTPKFKAGDRVKKMQYGQIDTLCTITSSLYCFERKEWGYGAKDYTNPTYQEPVHYMYRIAGWESDYELYVEDEYKVTYDIFEHDSLYCNDFRVVKSITSKGVTKRYELDSFLSYKEAQEWIDTYGRQADE